MINILINGQNANVRNIQNIGFKSNFIDQISELEVNVDSLILVNESRKQVLDWVAQYGYHVGIPTHITYGTLTFDYYIDLSDKPRINSKEIEVKIKKRKGSDNFFDLSNATTFDLMARKGLAFNTIDIPYVIVPDNQLEIGITLALGIFTMTQATLQAVRDTAYLVEEAIAAVAGLSPALAISAIAKALVQLAYTTALVIALLQMIARFRELIFPKVRYFKGMNVKELLIQSCAHLGFTFESETLDALSGLTILPVPLQKEKKSIFKFLPDELTTSFTKGYPTASDTVSTLGATISALEVALNGKTKVNNGVVKFERWDVFQNLSTLQQTPALNLQSQRDDQYTVNTNEAWIRYFIKYQLDYSDIHTLDQFEPTNAEYGTENVNQLTPDLNLIKGLVTADIPFSLGVRKSELSWIENYALSMFSIVDTITGVNTSALIENRLGVVQISQQFYSNTKLLYIENGKQPANYLQRIGAPALWTNYHSINQIQQNGFNEYETAPLMLNFEQFNQLINNNYITIGTDNCEIVTIDFVPYSSKAIISYRVPNNYANGKITTFVINE